MESVRIWLILICDCFGNIVTSSITICHTNSFCKYENMKISKSANKFIREQNIRDVTFNLIEQEVAGCCIGVVKEINPVYEAPADASNYRYIQTEGCHVFISRKIKILGPLTLTTEGLWKKRLFLSGAIVPI